VDRCQRCGEPMTRSVDHNCGRVTITRDRLRTLEDCERELLRSSPSKSGSSGSAGRGAEGPSNPEGGQA
jgi:hypothetical protein